MRQTALIHNLEVYRLPSESPDEASFGTVVLLTYDVAVGSASWSQLANTSSRMLGGRPLSIFVYDPSTDSVEILGNTGESAAHLAKCCLPSVRAQAKRGVKSSPFERKVGTNGSGFGAAPPPIECWDGIVPGTGSCVAGMRLGDASGDHLCIAYGAIDGEPPSQAMQDRIDSTLPYVVRAAQVDRRLQAMAARAFAMDSILDRMSFGLFELDCNKRVVFANARARAIAERANGLMHSSSGVHATSQADEARLQKAIAEVLAGGGSRRVSIKRGTDLGPYTVLVLSVDRHRLESMRRTACVMFVTDPDGQLPPSAEAIGESLGLTPAEARVVSGLTMGMSLPQTATRLGVSINTARTQLARAMMRTGTNSQVALVRMVLLGPGMIPEDMR